jgi:putative colanic acid biosynthesis UDP-glucose lipid carrier transferase
MSQSVLLRASLPIAFLRLAQEWVPALLVAIALYVVTQMAGIPFDRIYLAVAALAAILSAILLHPPRGDFPILRVDAWASAVDILLRWAVVACLLAGLAYLSGLHEYFPRRVIIPWMLLAPLMAFATDLALSYAMRWVVMSRENRRSAVIVGMNMAGLQLADRLLIHRELCTEVEGFFDDRSPDRLSAHGGHKLIGTLAELPAYIRRRHIDIIFVALPMGHVPRVMALLDELQDSTASIYYVPDVFVFDLIQSRTADIMGVPVVAMRETPFYGYRGVMKRVTDISFTLLILLITTVPMLVIAALIKLTSRGPAIFRQRRYGLDGKEIVVYKFRTMRVTEDGTDVTQATRDDPRVTRVGGFLRRYSLDELPQLVNVLQGRMSLVGPRPHAVAHNEQYRRLIKGYMVRHKVLPGITGLAQVNGMRGETAQLEQMEARVGYDLEYLRHWSPMLDLKILVRTVLVSLGDPKAY